MSEDPYYLIQSSVGASARQIHPGEVGDYGSMIATDPMSGRPYTFDSAQEALEFHRFIRIVEGPYRHPWERAR